MEDMRHSPVDRADLKVGDWFAQVGTNAQPFYLRIDRATDGHPEHCAIVFDGPAYVRPVVEELVLIADPLERIEAEIVVTPVESSALAENEDLRPGMLVIDGEPFLVVLSTYGGLTSYSLATGKVRQGFLAGHRRYARWAFELVGN